MGSSKTTPRVFDQNEYDYTFYYCDNSHPFIVFTTCYCPLCDFVEGYDDLINKNSKLEDELDDLIDAHTSLVIKVKNSAPELLI